MPLDDREKRRLTEILGKGVAFDVSMAGHTYFRVGGPADALAAPAGRQQLADLVRWTVENALPYWIIGDGTNLLVRDGGLWGIAIVLSKGFDRIRRGETIDDGIRITAMAGTRLQALCRFAADRGLAGMNFAAGIPGTMGGAWIMNAGTALGAMGDVTEEITVMGSDGDLERVTGDRLSFGYRRVRWPGLENAEPHRRPIIVDGCIRLKPGDPETLRTEMRRLVKRRRQTQPVAAFSAGCFFRNPPSGKSAGELIELAGLKGRNVGGAAVSEKHANFIVNTGGATAEEILHLGRVVREAVEKKFAVKLEPEVQIVGSQT